MNSRKENLWRMRQFFETYRDQFDYLYDHEPMSLLHLAVHSHFGGRPLLQVLAEEGPEPVHAELDRLLASGLLP